MVELEASTFAGRVGETFRVRLDDQTFVELELLSVVSRDSDRVTAFSLEFRGPLNSFLAQRTYAFDHDEIGALPIFLVPIGQQADGFREFEGDRPHGQPPIARVTLRRGPL